MALLAREDDMRAVVARVRELGGLDDGPLPDGLASLEASISVLHATFALGRRVGGARARHALGRARGADSPWRPVVTWALGWAHYCHGELDLAERAEETVTLGRAAGQWIVTVAALADLSLIAGCAGAGRAAAAGDEAVDLARERGLLDAIEDGEVHTACGVALAAQGRREEALPELEQGVSCAGCGASRSISSTG